MTAELIILLIASLMIVPLSWCLPRDYAMDGVAAFSGLTLLLLAPLAFLWLALVILGSWAVAGRLEHSAGRNALLGTATVVLVGALVILRELDGIALIGGAYFTLRALHLLFDIWMQRLRPPSLRDFFRYLCFLPVMAIGPINRFQGFQRSIERRRFDMQALASGAERALLGVAQATILGSWLVPELASRTGHYIPGGFWRDWADSVFFWIMLYMVFAGFSSVAIGISAMCGIKVEENFRAPYRATSLIDFWTRWHITLSFWCRDYVFQPVSVILRSPLIGLFAGMAAIGLWHETSLFYVLWAIWQTIGIALNRIGINYWKRHGLPTPSPRVIAIAAPLAILAWLSVANPLIAILTGD